MKKKIIAVISMCLILSLCTSAWAGITVQNPDKPGIWTSTKVQGTPNILSELIPSQATIGGKNMEIYARIQIYKSSNATLQFVLYFPTNKSATNYLMADKTMVQATLTASDQDQSVESTSAVGIPGANYFMVIAPFNIVDMIATSNTVDFVFESQEDDFSISFTIEDTAGFTSAWLSTFGTMYTTRK